MQDYKRKNKQLLEERESRQRELEDSRTDLALMRAHVESMQTLAREAVGKFQSLADGFQQTQLPPGAAEAEPE